MSSSECSDERRGARPLSAFHTANIVDHNEGSDMETSENKQIGISPLHQHEGGIIFSDAAEGEHETHISSSRSVSPAILLEDDASVLQLLMHDEHADPPILVKRSFSTEVRAPSGASPRSDEDDEDEYLSAHGSDDEDDSDEKQDRKISASHYDYDVNWDMVGQLRRGGDTTPDDANQDDDPNNTSTCSSLAEAAAASMIASTAAATTTGESAEPEAESTKTSAIAKPPLKRSMFLRTARRTPHPAKPYSYKYQKYSEEEGNGDDEQGYQDVPIQDDDENDAVMNLASFPVSPPHPQADAASEMNESTNTVSNSSSSSGSITQRRTRVPLSSRRRMPRTASAPTGRIAGPAMRARGRSSSAGRLQSTPLNVITADDSASSSGGSSTGVRSSLDSGMAAVRRWVRSRASSASAPRSSHAARRWQREHSDTSTLALGEEDLFALSNAGEDPRGRHSDDGSFFHAASYRSTSFFPPSILEEDGEDVALRSPRQRAQSEPDRRRIRDFFLQGSFRRRRTLSRDAEVDGTEGGDSHSAASASGGSVPSSIPAHLSSAALNSSLFHTPQQSMEFAPETLTVSASSDRGVDADMSSIAETSTTPIAGAEGAPPSEGEVDGDPNRDARMRWIRINRRFQLIITIVALIFSLLLFAVLVCWVVLTSAYVVSIDKPCDVPLKLYYWLATLQLILDVFRTDIMRCIFRWDSNSNERIPARVIAYNIAYLIYALLVLRMGVESVFIRDNETCSETAPELFLSSTVFVCLSIGAWSTIVLGYLVPFCFVATLLTLNGYSPAADTSREREGTHFPGVFPAAYTNNAAPAGCIDQLRTVLLEEFPDDYPTECCICMGEFDAGETIVATECHHVTHKRCLQEWLSQARTCPVCRADIPSSLPDGGAAEAPSPPVANPLQRAFRRDDFHTEVVNIIQTLRRQEQRLRQMRNRGDDSEDERNETERSGRGAPVGPETELVTVEEGVSRQHSR